MEALAILFYGNFSGRAPRAGPLQGPMYKYLIRNKLHSKESKLKVRHRKLKSLTHDMPDNLGIERRSQA